MTTAQQALERTQVLYSRVKSRERAVQRADDYYRGKQKLRFASDKWQQSYGSRYQDFCDNWCAPVANSPGERLRVTGFRLDDNPQQSPAEKQFWTWWRQNDMEAQSSQGFLATIIAGRSYVNVWGTDDGDPVATWERADQMTIGYDLERPWLALDQIKTWNDGSREYATYITPTEVWKWERSYLPVNEGVSGPRAGTFFDTPAGIIIPGGIQNPWKPRLVDDTWPIANPLGALPGVEMPNRPMLGGEPLSDIGGVMAMQDAINLLWAYLFTQADFAGMPARVVSGQEPPKIPVLGSDGSVVGETTVPLEKLAQDRILWLTGENTKISQWDAADLTMFTNIVETCVTHIAAQTRTPPHYLVLGKGMVNVSADGMKAAETGLVMKVKEEQLFLTPAVRGVFQRFALVAGDTALAEDARNGVVQWQDAENHSEAQAVDALVKLQTVGFPFAWLAERYGLSQTEIDRVLEMKKQEAADDPLAALVRAPIPAQQLPAAPPAA